MTVVDGRKESHNAVLHILPLMVVRMIPKSGKVVAIEGMKESPSAVLYILPLMTVQTMLGPEWIEGMKEGPSAALYILPLMVVRTIPKSGKVVAIEGMKESPSAVPYILPLMTVRATLGHGWMDDHRGWSGTQIGSPRNSLPISRPRTVLTIPRGREEDEGGSKSRVFRSFSCLAVSRYLLSLPVVNVQLYMH